MLSSTAALHVHPAVTPLSYLLGTWRGQGEGCFPTIASFKYGEEIQFSNLANKVTVHLREVDVGYDFASLTVKLIMVMFYVLRKKPVIAYSSKTWKLSTGEPMHAESGYWRPKPDGTVEVLIAQSTGLVEVQKGTHNAEEKVVKLQSDLVGNASKVREITRVFNLVNGELAYVVEMATNQTSLQQHLKASLKKL